jgi:hypothetical protein
LNPGVGDPATAARLAKDNNPTALVETFIRFPLFNKWIDFRFVNTNFV